MSEITNSEALAESEKPVQVPGNGQFPPFPEPTNDDFEENVPDDERTYYTTKFKDLNNVTNMKVHCTACDRHLGLTPKNLQRMRIHPMLRTLVCQTCQSFYNSGEFEKGDDGSELYCRWCGQGGQVYCCSNCPHVFCAKCIKRNLGPTKIKEIEETEDWKCFKCNPACLKDLRAICWAAHRYCDMKTKIANEIENGAQKEDCIQDLALDHSECCRSKSRKKEQKDTKKKESESKKSTSTSAIINKIPPTIQVRKFASINLDDTRKGQKRAASPKNKPFILKSPISVATKTVNTFNVSPMTKKMRLCMPTTPVLKPIRIMHERKTATAPNSFIKIKPKSQFPLLFNGLNSSTPYNNMINNDNINLSLENLTQGLDMAAMTNIASGSQDDELVCTPDFPMEPLCEVTEDNTDDDVQCVTPVPSATLKGPPPLVPCAANVSEAANDNIIQMTENDVTVNATTGGLKFRVDPQTLSANKMYRLPDGRIFAINANPNMPGGYSATIVAVTETNQPKIPTGATYAAKINHVSNRLTVASSLPKTHTNNRNISGARAFQRQTKPIKLTIDATVRTTDLQVPVEWYRYNLIDAIDALEYSLSRLHKLKKEATTSFLRTRTIAEMRTLHKTLDNLMNTSTERFKEIRESLSKELKQYVARKTTTTRDNSDDDDDVEILPDMDDDPIYIDENSLDSSTNETQEVDLTGAGSEHNDSGEKILIGRINESTESDENAVTISTNDSCKVNNSSVVSKDTVLDNKPNTNGDEHVEAPKSDVVSCDDSMSEKILLCNEENIESTKPEDVKMNESTDEMITDIKVEENKDNKIKSEKEIQDSGSDNKENNEKEESSKECVAANEADDNTQKENGEHIDQNVKIEKKNQDIDISDEMIDDLLKGDDQENSDAHDICALEISDEIKDQ